MIKFYFIIIILTLVSCKEPLGIENNVDTMILEEELFPLSEGNTWCYIQEDFDDDCNLISTSDYTMDVTTTHFSKGKLWFQILKSDESFLDHFYRVDKYGLWYKIPQFFPTEEFLILNYQKNETEKLVFKDIFNSNNNFEIECLLIDKTKEIIVNDVVFICYQYNYYKVNKQNNIKTLFKECYFSKGVGLILEKEYKVINNIEILTSTRTLSMYNLKNKK